MLRAAHHGRRAILISLLVSMLSACGGDGSTRVCFSTQEGFCDRVVFNDPPSSDAGDDLVATAGDLVTLDGSNSRDDDGDLVDYAWVQLSGPVVPITDANGVVATFVAPDVDSETPLVFRLTVKDDDESSDTSSVVVTVLPAVATAGKQGVVQLTQTWLPDPLIAPDPQVERPEMDERQQAEFLGFWLLVQIQSYRLGWNDADPIIFLDQLRLIAAHTALHSEDPSLQLGMQALQAFTVDRDPAISLWASKQFDPGRKLDETSLELLSVEDALRETGNAHSPIALAKATFSLMQHTDKKM